MRSRALNLAALALLVGLCGWTGAAVRPAAGQALDAGKPPAQIFSGTCSACHRSPRGLVRSVSPGGLQGFLRQHYTTGSEMAGTMAAYVLGNGGTDRVAEPAPKREPRQRPKSDAPDVAARNPDQKEPSRSAKQRAGKKGPPEPSEAAKDAPPGEREKDEPEKQEPEKQEAARSDSPATEPAKPETAAVDCKVEEPKPAPAQADDGKAGAPLTPPRQPTALLTLPGFPPPEPEPEPVVTAAAPASPDCDPPASASAASGEEAPREQDKEPAPSTAPAAMAEASTAEPPRPAATEAVAPALDIMQEEVHAPRRVRTGQQKKRAP